MNPVTHLLTRPLRSWMEAAEALEVLLQGSPLLTARPFVARSFATRHAYYRLRKDCGQVTATLLLLELGRSNPAPQDSQALRKARRPRLATCSEAALPPVPAPATGRFLPNRPRLLVWLLRGLSAWRKMIRQPDAGRCQCPPAPSGCSAPQPRQQPLPTATPATRSTSVPSAHSTSPASVHQLSTINHQPLQ